MKEQKFIFSDKSISIARSSNSGLVETGNGFKATVTQLEVLSSYVKHGDARDVSKELNKDVQTVKNTLYMLRESNETSYGRPTTTQLAINAHDYGLLYPMTIAGIKAVLTEDLGSDQTQVQRQADHSQKQSSHEE
jgi:hypothetical protein